MAGDSERRDSNTQFLQDLEALNQSLRPPQTLRRTASLVLSRSPDAIPPTVDEPRLTSETARSDRRGRSSRRLSLSPWRSRHKPQSDAEWTAEADVDPRRRPPSATRHQSENVAGEKKGIWSWKPMRALSHIGMQRLPCLFSVEVVAVNGLPASMNGLRLSVAVRKKDTKGGAVQTMPSRVLDGCADFDETLFVRCHLYCAGKPPKFESRSFLVSMVAIDAPELDFGRSTVDLSQLVSESIEKSLEGQRVRQWDKAFQLSGKAKGGELVLKLGFQIMEDGGAGIYGQAEAARLDKKKEDETSSFVVARKQSKSSFSVAGPRISRSDRPGAQSARYLKRAGEFSLGEPKPEHEPIAEDPDLPEFEVIEKGIEIEGEASVSSEMVKEMVHERAHKERLAELDSIAEQIKALESMMVARKVDPTEVAQENKMQRLDAQEETVTREFLQMLEMEDIGSPRYNTLQLAAPMKSRVSGDGGDGETRVFLSDLGKSLGSVVQTGDGGYLASMNPFNVEVARKETPKLAMQISRPFILQDHTLRGGFEVFHRLAAMGSEELGCRLQSLTGMDELMGKTAEQIAFEGVASAIVSGRSKEGASSSAARSIAIVKKMTRAMGEGRKERISTRIWNAKVHPVPAEEILAFSLQKMESLAVEALKIQTEMAEEEAPFDVSPLIGKEDPGLLLRSTVSLEDWAKTCTTDTDMTMSVVIQLRDPVRMFEAVGAPMVAVMKAAAVENGGEDEVQRFKVTGLHVGGLKLRPGGKRRAWDGEEQRLTAVQWLVAHGLGKAAGRRTKPVQAKVGQDLLWSLSSRVMAHLWLKPVRNPDVKILSHGR